MGRVEGGRSLYVCRGRGGGVGACKVWTYRDKSVGSISRADLIEHWLCHILISVRGVQVPAATLTRVRGTQVCCKVCRNWPSVLLTRCF